jgi:hypothetical protein
MLILPAKMSPKPLDSHDGKIKKFHCEVCGRIGEGRIFKGLKKGEEWGVLPEEWEDVQDRRPNAKKKFLITCGGGDCAKALAGPAKA